MNTEVESGTVEPTVPAKGAPEAQPADAQQSENGTGAVSAPTSWEDLGIKPDLKQNLLEMGFALPMAVQLAVFPRMMAGKDVMVQSRTGSGKTAAFGIPFAQGLIDGDKKEVQALCLAPTRELALQVGKECEKIAANKLHVIPIYGGAPMGKQIEQLKAGAQVVAGTPGRVLDHLRRGTLNLDGLKILVLDEADEMLSMGFLEEITEIIKRCPTERQTVLFSATIPDDIERIGSRYMHEPEKIQLSADFVGVHEITHSYYMVSGMGRARDLVRVLAAEKPDSAIIFCNTREDTALVAEFLRKSGMDAEAISSDLTQKDRERVMGRMKDKNLHYLVATDIAARGIDISDLSHVINYTFPESAEVYVHRTGRTGRAGKSGLAISLISPRELGNFYMLKLTYKIKPEERTLSSDAEQKTAHEAQKVDELRGKIGTREPAAEWRALAKRVWAADDGERIMAALIEDKLSGRPAQPTRLSRAPVAAAPGAAAQAAAESTTTRAPSQAPRVASPVLEPIPTAGPTGGFSSPPPAQKVEARPNGEAAVEGAEKRPRRRRSRRGGGGGGGERREGVVAPRRMAETIDNTDGKEFWEAWVDSKSESPAGATEAAGDEPDEGAIAREPAAGGGEPKEARAPRAPRERERGRGRREREESPLPEGQVRLYLNLGRRDGAKEPEIEQLLGEKGVEASSLELRNSHTYLIVPEERADAVAAALSGGKFGERDVLCERARK
jgi:ATP-dependent RNA helicase DeaD